MNSCCSASILVRAECWVVSLDREEEEPEEQMGVEAERRSREEMRAERR